MQEGTDTQAELSARIAENARLAEALFGRKSGRHSHPATHPLWMEFEDGNCTVCGNAQ